MDRLARLLPPVALVAAAAWWVFGWVEGHHGRLIPSYDIYGASYPNFLYAADAYRAGHGLLWNPYQNCGQPFLPATLLAPFYPLHVVFLVVGLDHGFLVVAFLHFVVAGMGTHLLGREMGLGRAAALTGALAFELCWPLTQVGGWQPDAIFGALAWLPCAMLFCERTIRSPARANALGLALVLTLSLLAGYPQMTMFIYQLILLRVGWELVVGGGRRVVAASGALAAGLALPVALAAVYLLPATGFAGQSIRNHALSVKEMSPGATMFTLESFRAALAQRSPLAFPGTIAFAALAPLGVASAATRRQAAFYALASVLFTLLAIDGPVLHLYLLLPVGRTFRLPGRFLWLATFCLSMLCALGAEALARERGAGRIRLPVLVVVGGACALAAMGGVVRGREIVLLAALTLLAALLASRAGARRPGAVAVWGVPLAVGVATVLASRLVLFAFGDGRTLLHADEAAYAVLRARMTPAERYYTVARAQRLGLTDKNASVFRVRSITDYDPQTSRRLAELEVLLRTNGLMQDINDYGLRFTRMPRNRRILDLLATRYLLVDPAVEAMPAELRDSLRVVAETGGVVVYENPQAFPRAFVAGDVRVEPDPARRLQALAFGDLDLRRTVVLESAPPRDAPIGTGATGSATIEDDRSEVVRLRVEASAPGFVVLTDQAYPGWTATVDGAARPILRADHAFRAVAVPAGTSRVVFTYRPVALWLGAGVSLATLTGLAALSVRRSWSARRP